MRYNEFGMQAGAYVSWDVGNFNRRKRNGDGERGGDEGLCERAADVFTEQCVIAAK